MRQSNSRPAAARCVVPVNIKKVIYQSPKIGFVGPLSLLRQGAAPVFWTEKKFATASAANAPETVKAVVDKLASKSGVIQLYRYPGLAHSAASTLLRKVNEKVTDAIVAIDGEQCFNVSTTATLSTKESESLAWLLRETFEPELLTPASQLSTAATASGAAYGYILEVGPRMAFSTAFSTNAVSICESIGLGGKVTRLEKSRRYLLSSKRALTHEQLSAFAALVHDRMTEEVYPQPIHSFKASGEPQPVFTVPVVARGRTALEEINKEMGLAFDEWDLDYYTKLFRDEMKRDPTNVELFDIAQSNSEHSRHWFFRGNLVIDGKPISETLFSIVKAPWKANPNNSVVAFKDNSSAIKGFKVSPLLPTQPGKPSELKPQARDWDLLLTAETHNFPCAVAPYPGAETGAGGRMRDTHATGTGSIMGAGTAGYCVGNLHLDGYEQPHEDKKFVYGANLASPQQILIDASNGASDYGNKFGEPLVAGFCRTYGQRVPNGERREWLKPIMFSAGIGQIDHRHLDKAEGEVGMLVVKIGGPAYRIGMGGGAASSVPSGSNKAELDFNAVQRGDAEYSQKLWRVVRSCVELGSENPIVQIHDQGAGGNCNVVKEIIYPLGAKIDVRAVKVGDETLSVLEIWGAEYQENDCLLIKPEARDILQGFCDRERCCMQVIGTIDGSGRVTLVDRDAAPNSPAPVDLDLEKVLGKMPDKTFEFKRLEKAFTPLTLPAGETPVSALKRILRLPSVCSKRFLTNKVDRHVTGLIAQQQCVGPLHIPVADVAVMAQSHQDLTGLATAIGEQPIKGLIDPAAMARLALGEALTNLVFARATSLPDVRASVNWMYAAKMKDEGASMYDAAISLKDAMIALGVACDGGKDSLSMAAAAGGETVMAPGNLVVSAYVGCPDITKVVTPDIKAVVKGAGEGNGEKEEGVLIHVDLAKAPGSRRLGGSALAQVYNQLGCSCPDVDPKKIEGMWNVVQDLIERNKILAGHDISDGGIATTLLEMGFAGNCGFTVDLPTPSAASIKAYEDLANQSSLATSGQFAALFAEELGLVLQLAPEDVDSALAAFRTANVTARVIGKTGVKGFERKCEVKVGGEVVISGDVSELRDEWEETAFKLEALQCAEECVKSEREALKTAQEPPVWNLPFTPVFTTTPSLGSNAGNSNGDKTASSSSSSSSSSTTSVKKSKVAIIREEGSNGDREMSAAAFAAGLEPWDVTMSDLLAGRISLDGFQGIIFVGGFSYADTLDSAKGWAGTIRFNDRVLEQFRGFYSRADTWSLGICNGCQLMALLGWVPGASVADADSNGAATGAATGATSVNSNAQKSCSLPLSSPSTPATPIDSLFLPDSKQPRFVHNASGRFESRWVQVRIADEPKAVLLKGMGGSVLGVWCAHGEGQCLFPDEAVKKSVLDKGLAPIRYVDAKGQITENYPANPNGSPLGIAALCSENGRHLAMMPHPERSFLAWQMPWSPLKLDPKGPAPWIKLFQNARAWADEATRS
nr:phosphoribosylformylglycinamidine synthase (PURL) [Polytomella parva]|eukprot:CAMPEP_0175052494 /NCGR_PEP_ID=MMETSP0052_2-20121109/8390_1 /TAXON_ID=51329 ORGANISM="Polytomella parva, Strain SAG 63-3" /NCGR_SAMPLE_ID=MMETSP0052_2 /ASSEMBLY_ACC=CAM_ASM_000194 /LENGTH=1494 /DNA_ID=CAMNT_0016316903 /DNA_START=62 /DNA_END=4546 /DNA_ORIENTATION=-